MLEHTSSCSAFDDWPNAFGAFGNKRMLKAVRLSKIWEVIAVITSLESSCEQFCLTNIYRCGIYQQYSDNCPS